MRRMSTASSSCVICLALFLSAIGAYAASPTITFDSPRGGEVYALGQVQRVCLGVKTKAKTVTIGLSRDGGTTFETLGTIDNTVKDANLRNVLPFTVTGSESSNCIIRASGLIGKANVSVLSCPFSIGSAGAPIPGSVVTAGLADGSVTNPKLAAGAVSTEKMSSGVASAGMVPTADGSGGVSYAPPAAANGVAATSGNSVAAALNDTSTTTSLANYVKKSGDTMTGALMLNGDPASALHAATKQYVDAGDATKVSKTGDAMTGALALLADPTANLHAATKQYVDAKSGAASGVAASAGNSIVAALNNAATTTNLNSYVKKAGDTMTGTLNLPADGLVVGANELVLSGGNVGIGKSPSANQLSVAGSADVAGTLTVGQLNASTGIATNAFEINGALNGQILGVTTTSGGRPATFIVNYPASGQPAISAVSNGGHAAIDSAASGSGAAIQGVTTGTGNAGYFQINNSSSSVDTVYATSNGASGYVFHGYQTGPDACAVFDVPNASNPNPAIYSNYNGTGTAIAVNHTGSAGHCAIFKSNSANVARIDKAGRGYFDGGTQTGGADVAEAFTVDGKPSDYEPGDLLVVSEKADRQVAKSAKPYSTMVAGVYATKPGVLLTERSIDAKLDDTVPLGVVGVIPTKVSGENGRIRRGDLLVTSSTAGHAMKGTDKGRMLGAVIGKALENFDDESTGVIKVLVNVK